VNHGVEPFHIIFPISIRVNYHIFEVVLDLPHLLQLFHVSVHMLSESALKLLLLFVYLFKHIHFIVRQLLVDRRGEHHHFGLQSGLSVLEV